MSHNDYLCISEKAFFKKAIKDAYNNQKLSKLLAHLMFNDFLFSKKRVFLIIEMFNQHLNYSEVKNLFELLLQILKLEDEYTTMRYEWILGIPQISLKIVDGNLPKIPVTTNKHQDRLYNFISPVVYGYDHDSLLEKILYKYSNYGDFLNILTCFYLILFNVPTLFNYYNSLPSPMLNFKLIKEYIEYLAQDDLSRLNDLPNLTTSQEGTKIGIEKAFEQYQKMAGENDLYKSRLSLTPCYKFGTIVKESITFVQNDMINEKGIYMFIVEYDTEVKSSEINVEEIKETQEVKLKKGKFYNYYDQVEAEIEGKDIESTIDIKMNNLNLNEERHKYNYDLDNAETREFQLIKNNLQYHGQSNKDCESSNKKYVSNNYSSTVPNIPTQVTKTNHQSSPYFNEGTFYNGLKELFLLNPTKILFREFKESEQCYSTIKKYVLLNTSEKEYKIKMKFMNPDEFSNCYIPSSEIVSILQTRSNYVTTAYSFVKVDHKSNWNDIFIVELTMEDKEFENSSKEKINIPDVPGPIIVPINEPEKKSSNNNNKDQKQETDTSANPVQVPDKQSQPVQERFTFRN